jgi:branched-chain amino acid transport system ATP-binding protein
LRPIWEISGLFLDFQNITVGYYQDLMVLQDVSLQAREERITTIIGPNGAGKSTVLKTAFGFLKPMNGKILLNEKNIAGLNPFTMPSKGMVFIMQDRGIFPFLSVEENLELGAWLFKKDKRRVKQCIEGIYSKYPVLKDRHTVYAGNLSGGEQRMLEIGKALMIDPEIILFDEPTAGLAPIVSNLIFEEVEKLRREKRTLLMVEQNVKKALRITDYVYVLEFGRVTFEGTTEEINLREAVTPWINW